MAEQLPSAILNGPNSQDSIFALELDTKQRFDNILSGMQNPIDYPIPDFNKDMFPNGLPQDRLLSPDVVGNTIGEALFSPDPKIAQLATDRIRQGQDKLLTSKGVGVPARYPYDKIMDKYLKGDFGYNPYMSIEENEDFNYRYDYMNQSVFERIFKNIGVGVTRFAGSLVMKLGQTFGYIGAMIGEGFQELVQGLGGPSNDFMTGVADNSLSRWFEQQEENMKESNLLSVFKPKGWEDKGFFQKLGHGALWTDEFADGAAFMGEMIASTYLLGGLGRIGSLGKLGATEINLASKMGKFGQVLDRGIRFSTGAKDLSGVGRWAFATTSESAFEASGKYKEVKESLIRDRALGLNDLTDAEIQRKAGDSAAASFKANMLILSASNAFENRYIFGPLFKKMGISQASGGERGGTINKLGKYIGISDKTDNLDNLLKAERKTYNYKTWAGKKIDWKNPNSRLRFYGSRALSSTAMEGFWEENAQLAVERLSSTGSFSVGAFLDKFGKQTFAAAKGFLPFTESTDPEAETNIGLGAIIGIGGTATAAKIGGGEKRFVGERRQKEANIQKTVDLYNKYRKEYLSFQDIYEKNEDGTPKLDADGNLQFKDVESAGIMDGMNMAMSMHSAIDKVANPLLRKHLQDAALSTFVFAAKSAGIFNKVADKFKNIESLDEEALKNLGYNPQTIVDVPYLRKSFEQAGKFYDEVYSGKPAKMSKGFTEEDERGRKANLYDAKMRRWSAQSIAEEYRKNLEDKEHVSLFSDEAEDQDPLVMQFNTVQYRIQKLQQFEFFSRDNGDFFSLYFKNQFEKLKKERDSLIEALIPKIDTGIAGFEENPLVFADDSGFILSKGLYLKLNGKPANARDNRTQPKTGLAEPGLVLGSIVDKSAEARVKSLKEKIEQANAQDADNKFIAALNSRDENMIKYAELLNSAEQYAYIEERLGNSEIGLNEYKMLSEYYAKIQEKDKQQDEKAKLHSVIENENGTFSVVTPKGVVIGTAFKTREEAEENAKDLDEILKESEKEVKEPVSTEPPAEKPAEEPKNDKKDETEEEKKRKREIVSQLETLLSTSFRDYISGMDLDISVINFINNNYSGNEDVIRQFLTRFFVNRYVNPLKDKINNKSLTLSEEDQGLINELIDVFDFINDMYAEGLNEDLYNTIAPEIKSTIEAAENYEYKEGSEEQQFEQVGDFFISQEPDGKWKVYNSEKESLGLTFNTREEAIADIEKSKDSAEAEKRAQDIERRRQEELDKINQRIEKLKQKEDRRVKIEIYRTLDINDNPVEVEITVNADGSRVLKARQVNEDGSVEPMAYVNERINNKAQASLTNEQLIEGYIGNEGNTLQRTNLDENPDQTYIDKINAKYDAELAELEKSQDKTKIEPTEETTELKVGDTVKVLTQKDGVSKIKEDRGDKVLLEDGRQVAKKNLEKVSPEEPPAGPPELPPSGPPPPPTPPTPPAERPPSEGSLDEEAAGINEIDVIVDESRKGGTYAFVSEANEVSSVDGNVVKLVTTTGSQKEQALRLHNVMAKMTNPANANNFFAEDKDGNRKFRVKFIKGDKNLHQNWIFDVNRHRYETGQYKGHSFPFIISVIVDSKGEIVYFDTQGNIVDKSNGQPVAFQFNTSDYQNTQQNKGLLFTRKSNMNVGPITTIDHGFATDNPLNTFNQAVLSGIDVFADIAYSTSGMMSRYGSGNSFRIQYSPDLYKFRTINEMVASGDVESDALFLIENGEFLEYSWDSRGTEKQLIKTGQVYLFDRKSGLYISLTAKSLKDVALNGKNLIDDKTRKVLDILSTDRKITAEDADEAEVLKSIHDFLRLLFYSNDISFSLEDGGMTLRMTDKRDVRYRKPLLDTSINFSKGISTISNPISGEEFNYEELMAQNLISGAIPAEIEEGRKEFAKLNKRLIFGLTVNEQDLIDMLETRGTKIKPVEVREDDMSKFVGKTYSREGQTTTVTVTSYKDGEFTVSGENGKETTRTKEQFMKDLALLQEVTAPAPSEEVQQEFSETKTFSAEELKDLMNKSDTSNPDDLKNEIDLGCD